MKNSNKIDYFNNALFDVYDDNVLSNFKMSLIKDFVDNYIKNNKYDLSIFNNEQENYSYNLQEYLLYKDEKSLEKFTQNIEFTSLNIDAKNINSNIQKMTEGNFQNSYRDYYFLYTILNNTIKSNFNDSIGLNNNYIENAQPKNCGIVYHCQNISISCLLLNKLPIIYFMACSDYDAPIQGVIYWSLFENKLKTYIPNDTKCQIYNKKYKCAYGLEYLYCENYYNKKLKELINIDKKFNQICDNYFKYYNRAAKNLIISLHDIIKSDIENFNNCNKK